MLVVVKGYVVHNAGTGGSRQGAPIDARLQFSGTLGFLQGVEQSLILRSDNDFGCTVVVDAIRSGASQRHGVGSQLHNVQRVREVNGLSVSDALSVEYQAVARQAPRFILQRSHTDGRCSAIGIQGHSLHNLRIGRHDFNPVSGKISLVFLSGCVARSQ